MIDEQATLREQLDLASQQLRATQGAEAAAAAALEQAQARLESAAAEDAGTRQRLDALQKQKVLGREACRAAGAQQASLQLTSAADVNDHLLHTSAIPLCLHLLAKHGQPVCPAAVLQAELQEQLQEQQERRQRAAQRASRLLRQLQAKGSVQLPGGLSLESVLADVQLSQLREATKGMLEALRALAAEHPELELVQPLEAAAGVKLGAAGACDAPASRPGSAARSMSGSGGGAAAAGDSSVKAGPHIGSPAGSQPGLGRCATPDRALTEAGCSRPGSSRPVSRGGSSRSARGSTPTKSPTVKNMQLQLCLPCSGPR